MLKIAGRLLQRWPALRWMASLRTGVDLISLGRLTHSAPALDVAMDME